VPAYIVEIEPSCLPDLVKRYRRDVREPGEADEEAVRRANSKELEMKPKRGPSRIEIKEKSL
jgi:hypothetical protein